MAVNKICTVKKPKELDLESNNKKVKFDSEIVEMPNEIWTKIMNYLPTKDIYKSFGLVSKRFHSLIGGIRYLQVSINSAKCNTKVIEEILKNSKSLIGLEMDIIRVKTGYENGKFKMTFLYHRKLIEAINLCHRLKSLKIGGCCHIKLNPIRSLKELENIVEQKMLQRIQTPPGVAIQFSIFNRVRITGTLEVSDLSMLSQFNGMNLEHLEIEMNEQIFGEFARLQFPALKLLKTRLINNLPGYEFRFLNNENSKSLMKNSPNLKRVQFQGPCISSNKRVLIKIFQEYGPIKIRAINHEQLRSNINFTDKIEIICSVKN